MKVIIVLTNTAKYASNALLFKRQVSNKIEFFKLRVRVIQALFTVHILQLGSSQLVARDLLVELCSGIK